MATAKTAKSVKSAKNTRSTMRPSFATHGEQLEIPDLLSLQTESFDWLVGNPDWRAIAGKDARTGLDEVFEEISPIEDSSNAAQDAKMGLSFSEPMLFEAPYTPDECKEKGMQKLIAFGPTWFCLSRV